MVLRLWIYFLRRTLADILEHRLISFISMGTISVSFFLLGAFALLTINLNAWLLEWGDSISISVYLEDSISEDEKDQVRSLLESIPGAELKGFISKEDAMADLREAFGSQAGLLDGFEKNPLPASFELILRETTRGERDIEELELSLEEMDGVDEVQYSEQWIQRLEGVLGLIQAGGFVVGGFLCLAVLFIATNTIKLTIYARREEIEIQKLVGATDWFVKIPFLIEGALQGLVGGVAALGALYALYRLVTIKPLYSFGLPMIKLVFLPTGWVVALAAGGAALGLASGFIAVGRFFNPKT
ncbi:MAG: permease-like cell division protein FtsX [Desulfobacteraceae bacterium]